MRTIDFLERYTELESILETQAKFNNPLNNISIKILEDVEIAATELRKKWELGSAHITNILELLEENWIKIYAVRNVEDFDGLSASVRELNVIVINKHLLSDRIRFADAHDIYMESSVRNLCNLLTFRNYFTIINMRLGRVAKRLIERLKGLMPSRFFFER